MIADKLHPRAVEELRALPIEVQYEPELTKATLEQKIPGVGDSGRAFDRRCRRRTSSMRLASSTSSCGPVPRLTTIDVRAASKRGIYVANCPGKNAAAVAELVFGIILSIDRRIPDAVHSLRAGRWERTDYGKAEGLYGKTIGIAGLGHIGREVAHRAKSFGLHPIAWSRSLTPARASELGVGYAGSIDELATKSDIFTVHLPLNDRTRRIVGKRVLELLPPKAIVVNAARADLVDYAALRDAVSRRGLRAGVDVYPDEPKGKTEYATDLFRAGEGGTGFVYGTPHIAASTDQAQLAIASETVRVIRSFLLEGNVPNASVNVSTTTSARFQLVIRMVDKVGNVRQRARGHQAARDQRRRGHQHGLRRGRGVVREIATRFAAE